MKKEYQKPSVDVYVLKMRGNLLIMSGDTDDEWGEDWEDLIDDFFNA